MNTSVSITIVIPVYNEPKTVIEVLRRVNAQKKSLNIIKQIIVVNDGSTDETGSVLDLHTGLYDVLIHRPVNGGKGAAIRDGLERATGTHVIFQDADLEYHPDEYAGIFSLVVDFGAEVVIGSRLLGGKATRVQYFYNRVANRIITFTFNLFNNTTFTDIYSGYLLIDRRHLNYDELKSSSWDQQAEILGLIIKRTEKWFECPISYYGRTYREGKKITAAAFFPVIKMIFVCRFLR